MTYKYKFNHNEENIFLAIGITNDMANEIFSNVTHPQYGDIVILNMIAQDPTPVMLTLAMFMDNPVFDSAPTSSKVFEKLINSTTQEQRDKAVKEYATVMEVQNDTSK